VMGPPITTGEKWQSTAIRNYQQESIELALQSLVKDPKAIRDISTVTVAVRFADLEEIKARIKELRQSIMHMMTDSGEPDCVYQLNFQVFPMTAVSESMLKAAGRDPDGDAEAAKAADGNADASEGGKA
jgi:uncharacterized protein (TIGR02147 family)